MSENATSGAATTRGYRKSREGLVVSDKMDKTVVVQVEDHVKHPKYGKVLRWRPGRCPRPSAGG